MGRVMMAVYTAITNGYDTLKKQPKVEGVDFVCFTDDMLTLKMADGFDWDIVSIKDLDHKHPKVLCHEFIPEYEQTLWIDGNVVLKEGFECIFDTLKGNHIATFDAELWHTVKEECDAVVNSGYEVTERAQTVKEMLVREKYPDDHLSACTVILRDQDASLRGFEREWMANINTYSRRDQLTFNYTLWKRGLKQDYFEGTVYNNKYLTWGERHI